MTKHSGSHRLSFHGEDLEAIKGLYSPSLKRTLREAKEKMTRHSNDNRLTRRTVLGGTAALATGAVLPRHLLGSNDPKPNSVINGVRIGCITYSYRGGADTAEYTLDCLLTKRPQ